MVILVYKFIYKIIKLVADLNIEIVKQYVD